MTNKKSLLIPDIKKNICKICQKREYDKEHPSIYGYKNCINEITCIASYFKLFKPLSFEEAKEILTHEELKELNEKLSKLWRRSSNE